MTNIFERQDVLEKLLKKKEKFSSLIQSSEILNNSSAGRSADISSEFSAAESNNSNR